MKFIVSLIITKLPVVACLLIARYLALKSIDGWGWFLFVACLVSSSLTIGDKKDGE